MSYEKTKKAIAAADPDVMIELLHAHAALEAENAQLREELATARLALSNPDFSERCPQHAAAEPRVEQFDVVGKVSKALRARLLRMAEGMSENFATDVISLYLPAPTYEKQDRLTVGDLNKIVAALTVPPAIAAPVARVSGQALSGDAARLDFMATREAWIAWSKDGESCRVFHRDEDGDTAPMMGWNTDAWQPSARAAIDAAMKVAE